MLGKFGDKLKCGDGRRIYLEYQAIIPAKTDTTNFQHLVWCAGNTL